MDSSSSTNLVEIHRALTPHEFEKLVGLLLVKMGFTDVRVVARPGDQGVDAESMRAPQVPGLRIDLEFKVQAKRSRPTSGASAPVRQRVGWEAQAKAMGTRHYNFHGKPQTRQEGLSE